MNINSLVDLFQHMEWADSLVWNSLIKTEQGKQDTKLREYFYHLHMVQHAFLRVWQNESMEAPFSTFEDTISLMIWGQDYYVQAMQYLKNLTDDKVTKNLFVPWAGMVEKRLGIKPQITTLGDTILQVTLHSLYHRGQINLRLREIGGEPPLVDYIAWVWLGRPLPNWPSQQK